MRAGGVAESGNAHQYPALDLNVVHVEPRTLAWSASHVGRGDHATTDASPPPVSVNASSCRLGISNNGEVGESSPKEAV